MVHQCATDAPEQHSSGLNALFFLLLDWTPDESLISTQLFYPQQFTHTHGHAKTYQALK